MAKIRPADTRPPYVQIADDLRASIAAGALKPGDRLPSGRDLAREYEVAPMTIQHALQVLRNEGCIITWQGRGVFVAENPPALATEDGHVTARLDALTKTVDELTKRVTRLERDA